MGEAKRRQKNPDGRPAAPAPWALTPERRQQFVDWTTRGAWIGIGLLLAFWLTLRFVGPGLGWWQLAS